MHEEVKQMINNTGARHILAFLAAVLIALSFVVPASAEGGNGNGSGGGKDVPFGLVSSSIPNGEENVDPNASIVLTFNKNVVNLRVRESNMKCFSLTDSKGNSVPIDIIMGDDQVNPTQEVKRTITIKPKSALKPGETYLLKISGDLQAKREDTYLGRDTYISFTVVDETTTSSAIITTTQATATETKPCATSSVQTISETETVTVSESSSATDDETETSSVISSESATITETQEFTFSQSDETEPDEVQPQNGIKKISPLPIILTAIVIAATAATVLIIKKKK